MDLKLIQRLVRLMKGGDVTELEISDEKEGVKVRLKRGSDAPAQTSPVVNLMQGAAAPAGAAGALPGAGPAGAPEAGAEEAPAKPRGKPVTSPMVGTFYRSPSPDQEAFVDVGSRIEPESVLCIIEAMKVMNEIKAELRGEVLEVLVENGEPVEYGQPLFLVREG